MGKQKQTAQNFLRLAIGCEKQTELSQPSRKISTLFFKKRWREYILQGVKGVGGELFDQ